METLNLSTWQWETRAAYPFHNYISDHANLIHANRYIVFGGWAIYCLNNCDDYDPVKTIAAYDYFTDSWEKIGELTNRRYAHGVIATQNNFLVVGGHNGEMTERCLLNDNTMTCTVQEPVVRSVEYNLYFFLFYSKHSTKLYRLSDFVQCRGRLLYVINVQKLETLLKSEIHLDNKNPITFISNLLYMYNILKNFAMALNANGVL